MHHRNVLAEFQDGEPRMVYARDRTRAGARFFLQDGCVTDELREYTRANLECIVPGCPDPRLKVVKRSRARDGFSHFSGAGGHSAETVFHQQAKALLVRWVQATYPTLTVAEEVPLAGRERQADVLVTWLSGQMLAFEFQHSALHPDKWRERHASYSAMGVADVWLLGNNSHHLVAARYPTAASASDQIALTPLQDEILAAGKAVLWLNPVDETVGFAYALERVTLDGKDRYWRVPVESGDVNAVFTTCPLTDCELTPDGIVLPPARALASNKEEWLAAKAEADRRAAEEAERRRAAQEAVRKQQREKERAEVAEREQAAAKNAARREEAIRLRELRHQDWLASPMRERIISKYGVIPTPIAAQTQPDNGVFAYPEEWHALLYKALIHGRIGQQFTIGDVYKTLAAAGIGLHNDKRARARSVLAYLEVLQGLGYLDIDLADNGWLVRSVTVLHDLDHRPALAAPPPVPSPPPEPVQIAVPPPPAPPEPDPLEPLPDYHASMGRIEHYMPGLQPVLRWHAHAIHALRTGTPATPDALREALQEAIGGRADGISDAAIAQALDGFLGRLTPPPA
jgi:hypothetical protein